MQGGAGLALLTSTVLATVDRAQALGGEPAELSGQLAASIERVGKTTAAVWSAGDIEVSLANASTYLEAVGHVVLAWIWLEQLLAADGRQGDFYDGKRQAARYFFRWELPKTAAQLTLLESLDTTSLDAQPAWF
jgi:hypothetical protein